MSIEPIAKYAALVILIPPFFYLLDKILAPHQKASISDYFESRWYQKIEGRPKARYKKIASITADSMFELTSRHAWRRFLLISIGISVVFFALSQVLQLLFAPPELTKGFDEIILSLMLSMWIWILPLALVISSFFFHLSLRITAHLLRQISNGDWLDALILPFVDLAIATFFLMTSIFLIHQIPLIYGANYYQIAYGEFTSIYDAYYWLILSAIYLFGPLGAFSYGSAYSVFLPTILFYLCFLFFYLTSLIWAVLDNIMSHAALVGSYKSLEGKPFTILGCFISAALIFGKIVLLLVT